MFNNWSIEYDFHFGGFARRNTDEVAPMPHLSGGAANGPAELGYPAARHHGSHTVQVMDLPQGCAVSEATEVLDSFLRPGRYPRAASKSRDHGWVLR